MVVVSLVVYPLKKVKKKVSKLIKIMKFFLKNKNIFSAKMV